MIVGDRKVCRLLIVRVGVRRGEVIVASVEGMGNRAGYI